MRLCLAVLFFLLMLPKENRDKPTKVFVAFIRMPTVMAYATGVVATVRAICIAGRATARVTTRVTAWAAVRAAAKVAAMAKVTARVRATTRGLSDRAIKKAMLITDLRDKLTLSCDLLPT